jgi:hypothetical protein
VTEVTLIEMTPFSRASSRGIFESCEESHLEGGSRLVGPFGSTRFLVLGYERKNVHFYVISRRKKLGDALLRASLYSAPARVEAIKLD